MSTRVFELVGPPGAGKSTIARTLVERSGGGVVYLRLREWRNLPAVARSVVRVALPFLFHLPSLERRRWNKFSELVQAHSYYDVVMARVGAGAAGVLLDQGPVYLLSILQRTLASDPAENSRLFLRHWEALVTRWARRLDFIVLLDASDDALYGRITNRGNRHPVVGTTRDEATRFLENARRSRDRIVARLQAKNPHLEVLRINTEETPLEEIVEQLLGRVGQQRAKAAGESRRSAAGRA